MKRSKPRQARSTQQRSFKPQLEFLEVRNLLASTATQLWQGLAANPQHTGDYVSAVSQTGVNLYPAQPNYTIRWDNALDVDPQYNAQNQLLATYGSPLVTLGGEALLPVKLSATGDDPSGVNYYIEARNPTTDSLDWSTSTDYVGPPEPAGTWTPSFGPALAVIPNVGERLYFPGPGGTVYFIDNPDNTNGTITGQFAFYGMASYLINQVALNGEVYINTPITADSQGNIYFGYFVTVPGNPLALKSGIARIAPNGTGTYVFAGQAANDSVNITKAATNVAPALSPNGQNVYAVVDNVGNPNNNGGNSNLGTISYLVELNSTTLAPIKQVLLKDPSAPTKTAIVDEDSTASPVVGPDGDVYFGVYGSSPTSHDGRGWLLHYSASLAAKTPGSFGWDETPTIVPSQYVTGYSGTSTYLIFSQYNDYLNVGSGKGNNQIALLDPGATQADPIDGKTTVMKQIALAASPTTAAHGGLTEWSTNSAAFDPGFNNGTTNNLLSGNPSIFVTNEDGLMFRWDLTLAVQDTGSKISPNPSFTQGIVLNSGVVQAYTPTLIGNDGTVYAVSNATVFAVGLPEVTVNDVTVTETKAQPNYAVFTVSLSGPYPYPITMNFATVDGVPPGGSIPPGPGSFEVAEGSADNLPFPDYKSSGLQSLTFTPGQVYRTVSVPIYFDPARVASKFFSLVVSNAYDPKNNIIIPAVKSAGICQIEDDHLVPGIIITGTSVYSVSTGPVIATFNVTLTDPTANTVTVNYTTESGTAFASQYQPTSGTLAFAPGQTNQQIYVLVDAQSKPLPDTEFFMDLTKPVNAFLVYPPGPSVPVLESAPCIIQNSVNQLSINNPPTVVNGPGSTATATFTVTLNPAVASNGNHVFPITVDYQTIDGSAIAGVNYVAAEGTLTFNPSGNTNPITQTISITVINNGLYDVDKDFSIVLSNPINGYISNDTGTVTIHSPLAPPTVSIGNVTAENLTNGNNTTFSFPITLSALSNAPVTITYNTVSGAPYTATPGVDYLKVDPTTIVIPAGATSMSVPVTVFGHTGTADNQLTFGVQLSNPVNASIGTGTGTGTIDNEYPGPLVNIVPLVTLVDTNKKQNMVFNVTLSGVKTSNTVTVSYTTQDNTALAGTDYTLTSGTLTFNPGVLVQKITVPILAAGLPQPDKTFNVNISNAQNATLGTTTQAVGYLQNGNSLLSISAPAALVDGTDPTKTTNMTFTVTLKTPPSVPVTVNYATQDGVVTNLLANAGFEAPVAGANTNPSSWTLTNPNEEAYLSATYAFDGAQSLQEGGTSAVYQSFTVTPGTSYTGSVYAMTPATVPTATDGQLTGPEGGYLQIIFLDANGNVINPNQAPYTINVLNATSAAGGPLSPNVGNQGWNFFTTTAVAPANAVTAQFALGTAPITGIPGIAQGAVYWDDAQFNATAYPAHAAVDYVPQRGTLTFGAGITTLTINVPIIGKSWADASRFFQVILSGPVNAIVNGNANSAIGIIQDQVAAPQVAISNVYNTDGSAGFRIYNFVVELSAPSAQGISIQYGTSDGDAAGDPVAIGSATNPAAFNYLSTFGVGYLAPFQTVGVISIAVFGASNTAVKPPLKTDFLTFTTSIGVLIPGQATIAPGLGAGVGYIFDDSWTNSPPQ
jgi:hypothetical protein